MLGYKLLMLASASVALLGCGHSPGTVKFVVPDGYTGPLVMRLHQPDGVELPVKGGAYVVEFSEEGEISVQNDPLNAFRTWHACYQDGKALPVEKFLDEAQPDSVALFPISTRGAGEEAQFFMYVGTPAEVRAWLSERLFSL